MSRRVPCPANVPQDVQFFFFPQVEAILKLLTSTGSMLWKNVTSQVDIKNYSYDFVLDFNDVPEKGGIRVFFYVFVKALPF